MNQKFKYSEVKKYINDRGDELISTSYLNNFSTLEIKCGKCNNNYFKSLKLYKLYINHKECTNKININNKRIYIEPNKIEYINGKIYKIQVKSEFINSSNILSLEQIKYIKYIYIGCTITDLNTRFSNHKKKNNECNSQILFELFGYNNLEIILIKEYKIQSEMTNNCLLVYETLYINKCRLNNINILNKQVSFAIEKLSKKFYRDNHKIEKQDINKNYYINNKEYFDNYNKQYYQNNKNNYYCNICNYYFVCNAYLEQHKLTKSHKVKECEVNNIEYIDNDLSIYYCISCNIYENSKKLFSKHIKSDEHIKNIQSNKIESENEIYKFKYECIPCNYKVDHKGDYKNHLLSKQHKKNFNITDDYLFKCEPCKYYQNIEKLYKRHLKSKKHINNLSI